MKQEIEQKELGMGNEELLRMNWDIGEMLTKRLMVGARRLYSA